MEITIRPWTKADLPALVQYANNSNIAQQLKDTFPHPYEHYDGVQYIQSIQRQDPVRNFAIDHNGEAIGSIGIDLQSDIYRKNAELGYWLAEPFWGKGIMEKAIGLIIRYGFETFEIDRLYAISFGSNLRSQKVLEKSGFRLEARLKKTIFKKGIYEDELIYGFRK